MTNTNKQRRVSNRVFSPAGALALLTAICLGLYGASPSGAGAKKEPRGNLKIVTTIFPAYDFARAAAGDRAGLFMLVRPGTEIHTFDPSPRDILLIQEADVFIYIGGESEAWVETLLKSIDTSGKTIVRLIEHVRAVKEEIAEGMEPERDEEDAYDEHIWTSPRNAALLVRAVADALCVADPGGARRYRQNAESYAKQFARLDDQFRALTASAVRKKIVVGDRYPFRYFSDAYGLEYRAAFPGCRTESDVSAATMAYLIKTLRDEGIPAIYILEAGSPAIARAVAEETGAEVLTLHSCHNVTKEEFESGVTCADLMGKNLESLRRGLY